MSNNINIADILRDCPKGMSLYTPIYGEVKFLNIKNHILPIRVKRPVANLEIAFTEQGQYISQEDAECCIFPSREMRDWSKFFKRGDVVYNPNSQMFAIFEGWVDDTYTEFNTTHNLYPNDVIGVDEVCDTECFVKAENPNEVISKFEDMLEGKYNPDTLRVEPVKTKHKFMPFDMVLVRDSDDGVWKPDFFVRYDKNGPHGTNGFYYGVYSTLYYKQCIPYNEKTAHLINTKLPYEEGSAE